MVAREEHHGKKSTPQVTAWEHEMNELAHHEQRVKEVKRQSLTDRQVGKAEFLSEMKTNPKAIADTILDLLEIDYNWGPALLARRAVGNKGSNRESVLVQLAALYGHSCPGSMARDAWKSMTRSEQEALSTQVGKVIRVAEKKIANGDYPMTLP